MFLNMKKVFLTGLLVFLVAAIAGYFIAAVSGLLPPFPSRLPFSKDPEPDQQQKILVILVDDLKSSNQVVESIWMVYHYPESQPTLVFLPVYSLREQSTHPQIQAEYKFNFLKNLSPEFRDSLEETYNLQWDKYLVLDNMVFSQIIQLVTGKKAPKVLAQTPNQEKPADYQSVVLKYVKAYCSAVKSGKPDPELNDDWKLITDEFWTNIPQAQIADSWLWFIEHPQKIPCNIISSK
jgi:hypothetical protein